MASLEPLRFERHFVEKVWGGRALEEKPGIELPAGKTIGETWEVVDRPGENSVVACGPFQGRTLRELMEERADEILGRAPAGKEGRFPLLVKYIDARENLSVQVHPDEESAPRIPGAEPKTEAWYVLDAEPGGVLYCGLRSDVRKEAFREVADSAGVVETLNRWDVRPGTCLPVRGGTVHAIGAGVTILEVQQNSDTTYRIWDWGREGRKTHLAQALECTRFGDAPEGPVGPRWQEAEGHRRALLARSDFFRMSVLDVQRQARLATDERFKIYAVVAGAGNLEIEGRNGQWAMKSGDVWLVPAACGYHLVDPAPGGGLQLVEMTTGA